jgi:LAO/AO transport system kinase
MDRHGFDEVIVETVGVGQAELAARSQVDTLILVIPPDAGDVVQAMKAGIMEIADVFAINKADMPSAAKMATEVKRIMALTHRRHHGAGETGEWVPPVVLTSQSNPDSIAELSAQVDRHIDWLRASGTLGSQILSRRKYRLRRWLERRAQEIIDGEPPEFFDRPHEEQMAALLQRLGEGRVR